MTEDQSEIIALCCALVFMAAFLTAVPLFAYGYDTAGLIMVGTCITTLTAVCTIKEPYDD